MVWWIVSGVLLLAVVIFLAVLAVLGVRVRPLRRAAHGLQGRAVEAEKLQTKVVEVQERAQALAERAEVVSAAAERLRVGVRPRGHAGREPAAGADGPPGGFDGGRAAAGPR